MKKKILILCSILICMFIFTACGSKTAINTDKFISTMESKGFVISDVTDQFAGVDFLNDVTVAMKDSGEYQIEFYNLKDESNAIEAFNINKEEFEKEKGSTSTESSASLKNYSTYSLTSNGKYMYVSRIDNTLIYLDVSKEYKDEVKEIINELGY